MRTSLDVNADRRFAEMAKRVKAGVAQFEAVLVLTLGAETAVAFVAGGIVRALMLLAGMDFGMNFRHDHSNPRIRRANEMPEARALPY